MTIAKFDPTQLVIHDAPGPVVPVVEGTTARDAKTADAARRGRKNGSGRRTMLLRRAVHWHLMGETDAQIARLVGVGETTIKNWRKRREWEAALAELQIADDVRMRHTREMLHSRQIDYLCEADRMAFDESNPAHVRAGILKDLMDRDKTLPLLSKHIEGIGGDGVLIPMEALERIGAAIAHGLRSSQPPTVDVTPERVKTMP